MGVEAPLRHSLACGLMSGTSVDGIDAAVVRFTHRGTTVESMELLGGVTLPFTPETRDEILALMDDPAGALERSALLGMELGRLFADAVHAVCARLNLKVEDLDIIGSHGQTLRHVSGRATLQVGEGSVIAQLCGVPVAWNFRPADIAAGGTGAPLVPFLDRILADQRGEDTAFLNLGGIGNLCAFRPECVAFDTGPANMIVDRLVVWATGGEWAYDRHGQLGCQGEVNAALLQRWMTHPFLALKPPKSAGREDFGSRFWQEEIEPLLDSYPAPDLVRTAEAYTAATVADAFHRHLAWTPKTLVVCGGGAHNPVIMADLAAALPGCRVVPGDQVGVSVDFKEAQAFALLGLFTWLGAPNTIPAATGARRAVRAGVLSWP